jgi:hypothetical protein
MSDLEKRVRAEKTKFSFAFFNSPDGALVMDHLDKVFGFHAPAFLPGEQGSYDTVRAAIRDGQRQVYLHIKAMAAKSHEQNDSKTEAQVSRD